MSFLSHQQPFCIDSYPAGNQAAVGKGCKVCFGGRGVEMCTKKPPLSPFPRFLLCLFAYWFSMLLTVQIEEDTDRDRYMSPLEAKNYGLIDEVIGGDEAGFQITGTTRDFPKTKEAYVNWVSLHVHFA